MTKNCTNKRTEEKQGQGQEELTAGMQLKVTGAKALAGRTRVSDKNRCGTFPLFHSLTPKVSSFASTIVCCARYQKLSRLWVIILSLPLGRGFRWLSLKTMCLSY